MDILWVLRPLRGGMRTHVRKILEHLDPQRERVTVAAPMPMNAVLGEMRPRALHHWHRLPGRYPLSPLNFWRGARRLGQLSSSYDLVHAHGLWAGLLWRAAEIRTSLRPPVLLTLHTLVHSSSARAGLSLIARRQDLHICAVSRAVRESAIGADAPIHVIPNGAERQCVVRIPGSGPARLLYVGRFDRRKGLDVLLAGLRRLRGGHWNLRVVGDGPLRRRYRGIARRMGLEEQIEWCGWQEDVTPHYHASDLLVSPSRSEASGLAVAEAMTFGVPPVASRAGGLAELVEHGRSGWLVPSDDPDALAGALSHLLHDEKMRKKLGLGARRRSRELPCWGRVTAELQTLYGDLLPGPPGR